MLTMINFIIAKNLHCSAPRRGVYKFPGSRKREEVNENE
jgi:hypothetical protein